MAQISYEVPAKVTIKNIVDSATPEAINGQARTGKRQVMTKAEADAAGFTVYQYLLDQEGNFVVDTQGAASEDDTEATATQTAGIDPDTILVVVRQSVKISDRYVQLYRTQQHILIPAGDELVLTATSSGAVAHYASLAVDGELEVVIENDAE